MSVALASALEFDLASAPAHSFLGLGGASPAHLRVDVRDLQDSWSDLASYFSTQRHSSNGLSTPTHNSGCSPAQASDLEALVYGLYRRVHSTLCGSKRLEVGDSVLAPHDYSFLSSFSINEGQEFKDTRVFSLYRHLAPWTTAASRRIDKPNYILYAETTEDDTVWSVGEGMGEVVLGPRSNDVEHWLDAQAWAKVRDSGREAEVLATFTERQKARGVRTTMHPDQRVPVGIARDMGADSYRDKVASATRTFRDFMARTGMAHSLFHLLAANEMCGAVLGWAIIGHKLVRMYVLGPSRIAIEITPPRATNTHCYFNTTSPHQRVGMSFRALETTHAFDRLPHSFLAPEDPSVFPPGPRINPSALQAFANVAAASVLRLGALDCTQALHPLPTTQQSRVAADMAGVLEDLTPLPTELCRYIVELSRGPALRREAPVRPSPPTLDDEPCEMGSECCRTKGSALGLGLGLGEGVELTPQSTLTAPTPGEPGPSQRKRRASEPVEGIERAIARARTPTQSDVSSAIPVVTPDPFTLTMEEEIDADSEHRPMDEHDHDHMPPLDPSQRARSGGIDWTALDDTLNRLALFVPVSPAEMDALVASQIADDLAPYTPPVYAESPLAMEVEGQPAASSDDSNESEESVPRRTLADEYDSDSESDIVD